ncbi:MAG: 2-hydroxyacyl-CoA dehydratase [Deltaproteobacteria bacterium]|nr:2-hydroxyacyl-CoA dehydratase [Deltaproteobacteria bacterium]
MINSFTMLPKPTATYCLGIDIGSISTEIVAVDTDTGHISFSHIFSSSPSAENTADMAYQAILGLFHIKPQQIIASVATGFGRHSVSWVKNTISEISCHARGVLHFFPEAKTVIDIGGQDSKVICLANNGNVQNFVMNDRCAAGTGRFIETICRTLNDDLTQLNFAAANSINKVNINSTCAVFAESEVVSLIAKNINPGDIMAAVFYAIANRTLALIQRLDHSPLYVMSGGVALNQALVKQLTHLLGYTLNVCDNPQIVGALGAALIARDNLLNNNYSLKCNNQIKSQPTCSNQVIASPNTNKAIAKDSFIAVLCSCFPREILYALNLPNRIIAIQTQHQQLSLFNLHPQICSIASAQASQIENLHANRQLLGVIAVDSCDAKRRVYDAIALQQPQIFTVLSAMPLKNQVNDCHYLAESYRAIVDQLCAYFNISFSLNKLWQAINASNETRLLWQQLMLFRTSGALTINEAAMAELYTMALTMPPSSISLQLQGYLQQLKAKHSNKNIVSTKLRLAILGCCINNETLQQTFATSAEFVVTDHCSAMRPWQGYINVKCKDPFIALADYTLTHINCPRLIDKHKFLRNIIGQVLHAQADGIVVVNAKFCTVAYTNMHFISQEFEKLGLPTLELELSGNLTIDGQLQTRCDAWLERLNSIKNS